MIWYWRWCCCWWCWPLLGVCVGRTSYLAHTIVGQPVQTIHHQQMKSSILLRLTQKYLVSCFIVVGFWSDPKTLTLFWRLLYLESVSIIFALAVGPIPFGVSTIANISIRTNASTSTSWTLVFCTQSWSHYFLGDSYLFWQIGALQLLALELSAPWIIFSHFLHVNHLHLASIVYKPYYFAKLLQQWWYFATEP